MNRGRGHVDQYDDEVGLGEIISEDGARVPFHCTAIADGSRTIAPGTPVVFELRPGLPGRWEAFEIVAGG